eukprot:1194301-Prorocentrum_minimum.AAC.6
MIRSGSGFGFVAEPIRLRRLAVPRGRGAGDPAGPGGGGAEEQVRRQAGTQVRGAVCGRLLQGAQGPLGGEDLPAGKLRVRNRQEGYPLLYEGRRRVRRAPLDPP